MSKNPNSFRTSLLGLPPELRMMIAREVAHLQASPSGDINKTVMKGDWRKAVGSIKSLSQVDAFFRDIVSEMYGPLALWTPYRTLNDQEGWQERLMSAPKRRPCRYEEYVALLGKCGLWPKQKMQLSQLPADQVRNMALTYSDLDNLYASLMWAIVASNIGLDHLQPDPYPDMRAVRLADIRQFITDFDRGQMSKTLHPMERFLLSYPCESLRFLTILLEDGEVAGWNLSGPNALEDAARNFRRGKYLLLPSPTQIDRAAELLLSLFPSLVRLTIVRRRLDLDEGDNWPRFQHAPEYLSYYEMRNVFGDESHDEALSDETCGVVPRTIPTFTGRRGIRFLQYEQVIPALLESDEMLLRCVHAKIAKRDATAVSPIDQETH